MKEVQFSKTVKKPENLLSHTSYNYSPFVVILAKLTVYSKKVYKAVKSHADPHLGVIEVNETMPIYIT